MRGDSINFFLTQMASGLKAKLFGRQLSYGSENESPQSFEEAFQQPMQMPPEMMEQQV